MIRSTLCKQSHKYRFLLMGDDGKFIASLGIKVTDKHIIIKLYDSDHEYAPRLTLYDILDTFMDIQILKELVISKLNHDGELKIIYFSSDFNPFGPSVNRDKDCLIFVASSSYKVIPEIKFSDILMMLNSEDTYGDRTLSFMKNNVRYSAICVHDGFHIPITSRERVYKIEQFIALLAAMYCEKYGFKINNHDDDDDIEDNDNNLKTYNNTNYTSDSMCVVNTMAGHNTENED